MGDWKKEIDEGVPFVSAWIINERGDFELDMERLEWLLGEYSPTEYDADGMTSACQLVMQSEEDGLKRVLRDHGDWFKRNVPELVMRARDVDILRTLYEFGFDMNYISRHGVTLCTTLAKYGGRPALEMLEFLKEKEYDFNRPESEAAIEAIKANDRFTIGFLLDERAPITRTVLWKELLDGRPNRFATPAVWDRLWDSYHWNYNDELGFFNAIGYRIANNRLSPEKLEKIVELCCDDDMDVTRNTFDYAARWFPDGALLKMLDGPARDYLIKDTLVLVVTRSAPVVCRFVEALLQKIETYEAIMFFHMMFCIGETENVLRSVEVAAWLAYYGILDETNRAQIYHGTPAPVKELCEVGDVPPTSFLPATGNLTAVYSAFARGEHFIKTLDPRLLQGSAPVAKVWSVVSMPWSPVRHRFWPKAFRAMVSCLVHASGHRSLHVPIDVLFSIIKMLRPCDGVPGIEETEIDHGKTVGRILHEAPAIAV